jgi:hypothetical protein
MGLLLPLRYYANRVSTTLTVLIMLKVSISVIVTLYYEARSTKHELLPLFDLFLKLCLDYVKKKLLKCVVCCVSLCRREAEKLQHEFPFLFPMPQISVWSGAPTGGGL